MRVKTSKRVLAMLVMGIVAAGLLVSVACSAYVEEEGKKYVVFGARQPVPNLDPSIHYDWSTRMIQESVYDALSYYVGPPEVTLMGEELVPKEPELVPWLAESWDATPDAKTWTFHLVKDAKFHNGDPVTAEAVRFSFVRTLELEQGPAWMFLPVLDKEGIEVVDDYTIVFHLKKHTTRNI